MPLIEFHCNKCSTDFEELIFKSSEIADIKCPSCQSRDIKRLYSCFAMRSSGSFSSNIGSSCSACSKNACSACSQSKEVK